MKNVLVTGGAGFIGSNFITYLLHTVPNVTIVNLDLLTYAGNLENLSNIDRDPHYHFIRGDVRDAETISHIFAQYDIDTVVHFAAESHVDRSITDPQIFLTTNILGTQTLLEAAKKHWNLHPEDKHCRDYKPGVKYLQVSTDEVYGRTGKNRNVPRDYSSLPQQPVFRLQSQRGFIRACLS